METGTVPRPGYSDAGRCSDRLMSACSCKLSFDSFLYSKGSAVADALLVILLLAGMLYLKVTSLKTEAEIFMNPPTLCPHALNLKSCISRIETGGFFNRSRFIASAIRFFVCPAMSDPRCLQVCGVYPHGCPSSFAAPNGRLTVEIPVKTE